MNFACWAAGTWAAGSWVVGSWCPGAAEHRGGYHPIRFEPVLDDDEEIFVLLMTEILLNE